MVDNVGERRGPGRCRGDGGDGRVACERQRLERRGADHGDGRRAEQRRAQRLRSARKWVQHVEFSIIDQVAGEKNRPTRWGLYGADAVTLRWRKNESLVSRSRIDAANPGPRSALYGVDIRARRPPGPDRGPTGSSGR